MRGTWCRLYYNKRFRWRQIDTLRNKIKNFVFVSLTEQSNHKVVIVDEADYMNVSLFNLLKKLHRNILQKL